MEENQLLVQRGTKNQQSQTPHSLEMVPPLFSTRRFSTRDLRSGESQSKPG